MITEIATFTARPGKADELGEGLRTAMPIIRGAQGCHSIALRRGVEDPNMYVYEIEWETLENHTVGFRGSPLFAEYRSHIAGLFMDPIVARHYQTIA